MNLLVNTNGLILAPSPAKFWAANSNDLNNAVRGGGSSGSGITNGSSVILGETRINSSVDWTNYQGTYGRGYVSGNVGFPIAVTHGFFLTDIAFGFSAPAGSVYYVYTNTNPNAPLAQWGLSTDYSTGLNYLYETTYPGSDSAYTFTDHTNATPTWYFVTTKQPQVVGALAIAKGPTSLTFDNVNTTTWYANNGRGNQYFSFDNLGFYFGNGAGASSASVSSNGVFAGSGAGLYNVNATGATNYYGGALTQAQIPSLPVSKITNAPTYSVSIASGGTVTTNVSGSNTNYALTISGGGGSSSPATAPETRSFDFGWWGDSITYGVSGYPGPCSLLMTNWPGTYFYNGGINGASSYTISTNFLNSGNLTNSFTIIWAGHNDMSTTPTDLNSTNVLPYVSNMVARLPSPKRFIVLSILNDRLWTNGTSVSSPYFYNTTNTNFKLSQLYPTNYYDIRTWLVAQGAPGVDTNTQDNLDYSNNVPPNSLMLNTTHPNLAGYVRIATNLTPVFQAQLLTTTKPLYNTDLPTAIAAMGGTSFGQNNAVIGNLPPWEAIKTTLQLGNSTVTNVSGNVIMDGSGYLMFYNPTSTTNLGLAWLSTGHYAVTLQPDTSGNLILGNNNFAAPTTQIAFSQAGNITQQGSLITTRIQLGLSSAYVAGGATVDSYNYHGGTKTDAATFNSFLASGSGLSPRLVITTGVVANGVDMADVRLTYANLIAGGQVTATNGIASFATNQVVTSSSTLISNSQPVNMTVYLTAATGLSMTNSIGVMVFSGQTVAALTPFTLQPKAQLVGTAITCVGTNAW